VSAEELSGEELSGQKLFKQELFLIRNELKGKELILIPEKLLEKNYLRKNESGNNSQEIEIHAPKKFENLSNLFKWHNYQDLERVN
jgi:hypothetical protein